MADQLFVDAGNTNLDDFAADCFRTLAVSQVLEYDSDSYDGGGYFEGRAVGLRLRIALVDDRIDDFKYWLTVSRYGPPVSDDAFLRGCGDNIARLLAERGWRVARPATSEDFTEDRTSRRYLVYASAAAGDVTVEEKTIT